MAPPIIVDDTHSSASTMRNKTRSSRNSRAVNFRNSPGARYMPRTLGRRVPPPKEELSLILAESPGTDIDLRCGARRQSSSRPSVSERPISALPFPRRSAARLDAKFSGRANRAPPLAKTGGAVGNFALPVVLYRLSRFAPRKHCKYRELRTHFSRFENRRLGLLHIFARHDFAANPPTEFGSAVLKGAARA